MEPSIQGLTEPRTEKRRRRRQEAAFGSSEKQKSGNVGGAAHAGTTRRRQRCVDSSVDRKNPVTVQGWHRAARETAVRNKHGRRSWLGIHTTAANCSQRETMSIRVNFECPERVIKGDQDKSNRGQAGGSPPPHVAYRFELTHDQPPFRLSNESSDPIVHGRTRLEP